MNRTMRSVALAGAVLLAGEARALAQTAEGRRVFVNVNVGVQLSDRSISTTDSFPLYDEEATVAATLPLSGGALFDIGGGYEVMDKVFAGIAISSFGDEGDSTVNAAIPDLLIFDNPANVTLTAPRLSRREVGTHLHVGYLLPPVMDDLDVVAFIGPSFIRLKQEFVTTVAVAPNTQDASAVVVEQSGTGAGFNIGVDGTYTIRPNLGIGLFLRYVRASVDLEALPDAKASSVQLGVGARLRF
jgi:hypothetical protein